MWPDADTWDLLGKVFAALAGGGTFLYGCWRYGVRPIARFGKSVMQTFQNVEDISKQLRPNGGGSLRDGIDRIEMRLTAIEQRNRAVVLEVPYGVFEADASGSCLWVNRTFLRLTGRGLDEVLGSGWISAVAPEDRAAVSEEWAACIAQGREFSMNYDLVDLDGHRVAVRTRALPLRAPTGTTSPVFGYIGIVHRAGVEPVHTVN